MQPDITAETPVDKVRRFNRFYTRRDRPSGQIAAGIGFSLAEARVLFELNQTPGVPANEIIGRLGLDRGYLSRILQGFTRRRLIARTPDGSDRRMTRLALTARGREAFAELDRRSSMATTERISAMSTGRLQPMLNAMATIERCLSPAPQAAIGLRPLRTGDIGWIVHRQGLLYQQEFDWDGTYEALAAKILAEFVLNFDSARERAWVADWQGSIMGSVFLVRQDETTARLRLLYAEPEARGSGLGRQLVAACTAFAREAGYRRIVLWTQSNLLAARRLYVAEGYRLTEEKPHHSFGHHLIGETWELNLHDE